MVLYDSILGLPVKSIMGFDNRVPFQGTMGRKTRIISACETKRARPEADKSRRGLKKVR